MIYNLYTHTGCDLQNVDFLPGSFDPIRDPGAESNDRGVEVGGSITPASLTQVRFSDDSVAQVVPDTGVSAGNVDRQLILRDRSGDSLL